MSAYRKYLFFLMTFIVSAFVFACDNPEPDNAKESPDSKYADVVSVSVAGSEGEYLFAVGISSPDTGCEQFADWWEIIDENEWLVYRRILRHSHVNEQPFTRSGSPVNIAADQKVWIRAHMNNAGYGGKVFFGSVDDGFEVQKISESFGLSLDQEEPLPDGCDF